MNFHPPGDHKRDLDMYNEIRAIEGKPPIPEPRVPTWFREQQENEARLAQMERMFRICYG